MKRSALILPLCGVALVGVATAPIWLPRWLSSSPDAGETPPAAAVTRSAGKLGRQLVRELAPEHHSWTGLAQSLGDRLFELIPSLLAAMLVLAVFWLLNRAVRRLLRPVLAQSSLDPAVRGPVLQLVGGLVWSVGVLAAASQLGLQVGSIIAGLGVAGLAVSLAAQETLANFIAGVALLWDRPFRIGDNVTVSNTFGTVVEIGLRSTRLRTLDNIEVAIPNKEVANQKIANHTRNEQLRLVVPFAVAHGETVERVREVVLARVAALDWIEKAPAPLVLASAIGEAGVQLELRAWVGRAQSARPALQELTEQTKAALDEAAVEMAMPRRVVQWLGESPAVSVERGGAAAQR